MVTAKPTIKTQPAAQTAVSGDTVTFRITASGKALQYQWYYRTGSAGERAAVKAASGKTAKYSLTTAARHDGYQYRCVVKNPKGSVTSSTVKLTVVTEKPTITVQPKAVTVVPGDSVKFKVSASGAARSYQWYYRIDSSSEWKAVSAASGKTAAYSLTAEARHNGYLYKCVVKNLKGSVTSSVVKLTVVSSKPVIKTQPKAQTAASGDTVTFKIAASGTALTYQWYYRVGSSEEWMAVTSSGGKTASYSLTAASRHNGYQYMCIVKNLKGSVTSSVVKLTVVAAKPVIITQPKAVTVSAGNKATFKVVANGNGLKYQWYYRTDSSVEWKAVSAASGKTAGYSLTAEARHNGYQYKCVVENLKGSVTSSIVRLTVK